MIRQKPFSNMIFKFRPSNIGLEISKQARWRKLFLIYVDSESSLFCFLDIVYISVSVFLNYIFVLY